MIQSVRHKLKKKILKYLNFFFSGASRPPPQGNVKTRDNRSIFTLNLSVK